MKAMLTRADIWAATDEYPERHVLTLVVLEGSEYGKAVQWTADPEAHEKACAIWERKSADPNPLNFLFVDARLEIDEVRGLGGKYAKFKVADIEEIDEGDPAIFRLIRQCAAMFGLGRVA